MGFLQLCHVSVTVDCTHWSMECILPSGVCDFWNTEFTVIAEETNIYEGRGRWKVLFKVAITGRHSAERLTCCLGHISDMGVPGSCPACSVLGPT